MAPTAEAVFATLLMNDAYLSGAMVLGHSLKDRGAKAKLVVLVTLDNLLPSTITELKTIYDEIVPINRIINKTPANLYLMDRPDLISTFTKIELWKQLQYRQIVYIDADAVCLRAPNELLNLDADFAAAPDIGWPDCFNSGVMVLRPNMADYYSLLALAQRGISFDGGDQGLLNMHYREWERLSFAYNCTPSGNYQYIPAYRHFQHSISVVHFIGREKPWTLGRENRYSAGVYGELLGRWWSVYDRHYRTDEYAYMSGQSQEASDMIQEYLKGEKSNSSYGYSSAQPATVRDVVPEQSESVLSLATPERQPSPPRAEWDAQHTSPPIHSRPEASNFPTDIYTMSKDTKMFTPPSRYPEPPKDMYYQVPERAAGSPKPKQIFPWEAYAPKATRVFLDDRPPVPETEAESEVETELEDEDRLTSPAAAAETKAVDDSSPQNVGSPDPWRTFSQTNAWDEMPEIERYVQAFAQGRRGNVQIIHHTVEPSTESGDDAAVSPTEESRRRPSMRLTDFPSEIERPSLPVTPAPRRPSFWREERDELGELPAAEGVPTQEEWDPVMKLEELQRRHSEIIEKGPLAEPKELPRRAMPGSWEATEEAERAAEALKPSFVQPMPNQAATSEFGKEASKEVGPVTSGAQVSTTA